MFGNETAHLPPGLRGNAVRLRASSASASVLRVLIGFLALVTRGRTAPSKRDQGPLNVMDHALRGLVTFVGIGFQYSFNQSGFDRPHQNVPIHAIFCVLIWMRGLAEALFRFGLRIFLGHGGHIAQKGRRVKVLFHHHGGWPEKFSTSNLFFRSSSCVSRPQRRKSREIASAYGSSLGVRSVVRVSISPDGRVTLRTDRHARSLLVQMASAGFGDANGDDGVGPCRVTNLGIKPRRDAHHKADVVGFQPQDEVRRRVATIKEHQIGNVRWREIEERDHMLFGHIPFGAIVPAEDGVDDQSIEYIIQGRGAGTSKRAVFGLIFRRPIFLLQRRRVG